MSLCVVSNLGCLPTPTHNKCSVYTQKYFLILYPGEPFLDRHVFNTGLISRLFFPNRGLSHHQPLFVYVCCGV